tara:strand:+ start:256 stop:1305 length:1050 start_codon:yes stop_codon:yes gene_type:complete
MYKKILVIGSYPYPAYPKSIGGATNLVKGLLDYLIKNNVSYRFISTNILQFRSSNLFNYVYTILRALILIPFSKIIIVNCSKNGAFFLYPIIFLISKILGKKIVFRMFGGNFIKLYSESNYINKKILFYSLKYSNIIFFETKYIIKYCKKIFPNHNNILWFPNIRSPHKFNRKLNYKKKFVFMSHIKYSKGIENIFDVANTLNNDYSFDFYGPIIDEKYTSDYINSKKNCNYYGVIKSEEVQKKLVLYDFVILPTFYSGEGYPGIIIEAFSVGLPVIATNLDGISEIVNHNKNGLLIPVKDTKSLLDAIISINDKNYKSFSKNAQITFNNFNSESIYPQIIDCIYKLKK